MREKRFIRLHSRSRQWTWPIDYRPQIYSAAVVVQVISPLS